MANEKNESHTLLDTGIQGEVKIADDVVAAIAAIAAAEVDGVGKNSENIGSAFFAYVGMKKHEKGVKVEVAEGIAHVEMTITVRYGYNIPDVSKKVQEKVKASIENMTGLSVADVDVRVAGLELKKEDEE